MWRITTNSPCHRSRHKTKMKQSTLRATKSRAQYTTSNYRISPKMYTHTSSIVDWGTPRDASKIQPPQGWRLRKIKSGRNLHSLFKVGCKIGMKATNVHTVKMNCIVNCVSRWLLRIPYIRQGTHQNDLFKPISQPLMYIWYLLNWWEHLDTKEIPQMELC
jgi:hypothetical protein